MEKNIIFLDTGESVDPIAEVGKIKLKGEHNYGNIMAAIVASWAAGASLKAIRDTVEKFTCLAHRLELVRERNGVKYYNDSAATTPESAISGIGSFSENIIWIGGGSDKNLNMETLANFLERTGSIRKAILIQGEGTNKLLEKLSEEWKAKKVVSIVDSMYQAVVLADEAAKDGEIVLLSPGAASFGVFKNEFDRGDQFRKFVSEL